MSATQDNLARWREAERGATEGPWVQNSGNGVHTTYGSCVALSYRYDADTRKADAAFIATSREAMPALLAAIEDILALCDKADARPIDGLRKVHTASIRQVAERHLTTSSTPTTGERSVEPAAVTGSGRTADTGGLDSPGVGTSTTKEQS